MRRFFLIITTCLTFKTVFCQNANWKTVVIDKNNPPNGFVTFNTQRETEVASDFSNGLFIQTSDVGTARWYLTGKSFVVKESATFDGSGSPTIVHDGNRLRSSYAKTNSDVNSQTNIESLTFGSPIDLNGNVIPEENCAFTDVAVGPKVLDPDDSSLTEAAASVYAVSFCTSTKSARLFKSDIIGDIGSSDIGRNEQFTHIFDICTDCFNHLTDDSTGVTEYDILACKDTVQGVFNNKDNFDDGEMTCVIISSGRNDRILFLPRPDLHAGVIPLKSDYLRSKHGFSEKFRFKDAKYCSGIDKYVVVGKLLSDDESTSDPVIFLMNTQSAGPGKLVSSTRFPTTLTEFNAVDCNANNIIVLSNTDELSVPIAMVAPNSANTFTDDNSWQQSGLRNNDAHSFFSVATSLNGALALKDVNYLNDVAAVKKSNGNLLNFNYPVDDIEKVFGVAEHADYESMNNIIFGNGQFVVLPTKPAPDEASSNSAQETRFFATKADEEFTATFAPNFVTTTSSPTAFTLQPTAPTSSPTSKDSFIEEVKSQNNNTTTIVIISCIFSALFLSIGIYVYKKKCSKKNL